MLRLIIELYDGIVENVVFASFSKSKTWNKYKEFVRSIDSEWEFMPWDELSEYYAEYLGNPGQEYHIVKVNIFKLLKESIL